MPSARRSSEAAPAASGTCSVGSADAILGGMRVQLAPLDHSIRSGFPGLRECGNAGGPAALSSSHRTPPRVHTSRVAFTHHGLHTSGTVWDDLRYAEEALACMPRVHACMRAGRQPYAHGTRSRLAELAVEVPEIDPPAAQVGRRREVRQRRGEADGVPIPSTCAHGPLACPLGELGRPAHPPDTPTPQAFRLVPVRRLPIDTLRAAMMLRAGGRRWRWPGSGPRRRRRAGRDRRRRRRRRRWRLREQPLQPVSTAS